MTTLTFRARRRAPAITAALAAAPLYRGRILRGLSAPGQTSLIQRAVSVVR